MDASRANVVKGRAPLRASYELRSALAKRGKWVGSISYVYSPKNHRDIVLASDLELCHFLNLEGRADVESYDSDPDRIVAHLGKEGYVGSKPDAIVTLRGGHRCIAEVKYQTDAKNDIRASFQFQVQQSEAEKIGASWYVYNDEDAMRDERFLHDWLQIVTVLSSTMDASFQSLDDRVIKAVKNKGKISLRELQQSDLNSWDVVFPSIFQLCQRGLLFDDVSTNPLGWSTVIGARP